MRHTASRISSLLLAAALLLALPGCELPGTDAAAPTPEPTPLVVVGESTGEALQDTYKADHIFSLNCVKGASFNPLTTNSAWNQIVGMLAYDTLVKAGGDFEAEPNLILGWDSQDGRIWTFTVDTSRKFHDGGSMTANDAVYTLEMCRANSGRYTTRLAHVTSVSSLDRERFTVELDQVNWRFYELLNIPCIEYGSYYKSIPPGTGPYKFNNWGTALTLFQDHPDADEMPLRTIFLKHYTRPEDILQAFEDSLLDLVTNNPADASSLGYSRSNLIKYVETSNMQFVGFNPRSNLFSYAPYRQMVTYAIDRDTIVSNAMQGAGVAATLPIHPNSPYYPKTLAATLEYSPDDLQTVVTNLGGMDLDQDGVLEFGSLRGEVVFLVCADSGAKVSAARQIAGQLRSVGFSVTMSELAYADYITALQEGRYDLYYGEIKLCNDWDLSQLLLAGGTANLTNYQDGALASCIQGFLAANPADPAAMTAAAETLYTYIAQNALIAPVCFERNQLLYHRGVLKTINPNQDDLFSDMQNWVVDLS